MAGREARPAAGPARGVAVLTAKYLMDVVKSPAMMVSVLLPLVLMVGLRAVMGGNIELPEQDRVFMSNVMAYTVLFECVIATSMVVLYAMAEEREKHVLRTLMLADVRLSHLVIARGIAAMAVVAVADALCLAALDARVDLVAPFLLVCIAGSLPLVLLSLALGLFARDQMSVMVLDTPLMLAAILPMFLMYSEELARLTPFLPTGGLYELTLMLWNGRLLSPEAVLPAAMLLVWTAVMAAVLVVALRKAPREA